jgi:anthranilate 1,2-dioxygenase small subunit
MIDQALEIRVRRLFDQYARALDDNDLEVWPEFFVEDGIYEVIPRENVELDLPAPLFLCRGKPMLRDRVVSLRHANIFAEHRIRHFWSALSLSIDDGALHARSNYMVVHTPLDGDSFVYQAGTCEDILEHGGDNLLFRCRRIVYDTSRVRTAFAVPV